MNKPKALAPISISVFIILYYIAIAFAFIHLDFIPLWIKFTAIFISFAISILVIKVLVERIKEIQNGEEDDLSQY